MDRDHLAEEEGKAETVQIMTKHTVQLLDKIFNATELKQQILPNLRLVPVLHDTDLMWRISMFIHKKAVKKQDMLALIRDALTYINMH